MINVFHVSFGGGNKYIFFLLCVLAPSIFQGMGLLERVVLSVSLRLFFCHDRGLAESWFFEAESTTSNRY